MPDVAGGTDERLIAFLRGFVPAEDEPLRAARARSEEADIRVVAPESGALLRFFARMLNARHVVEVGSGGGYSGLWLLGGMDPRGALTTIDIDRDHQALAQRAFADARLSDRVRSMLGPALAVLPKLADGQYDVMFLDSVPEEYPEYLEEARRLLRPGGLLLAEGVLAGGGVADPATEDAGALALALFAQAVRDSPDLRPVLLPVGDGLLAALVEPG